MTYKCDLPFTVGQEVEAKFNESGYRGAWFRCQILEIKYSTAEPSLLLKYLDFPDEACSWAPVRQSFPATKLEAWRKDKKTFWMVRPKLSIIHESEFVDYQEKIRMGRECHGYVHIYNHTYMVGDNVDWWKDDCYWIAKIIGIESDTNKAKLRFPTSPHGEGNTDMAPLENLRPSFTWTPRRQWRQMGLKRSEPRKGLQGYTSYKSPVQLVYFSGGPATPTVVADDLCGPVSSRNASSGSESETGVVGNSRCTPGEERHNDSGSKELAVTSNRIYEESKCTLPVVPLQSIFDSGHGTKQHVVYSRSKFRNKSITSGATSSIDEEVPEEVRLKKFRRKVLRNSAFTMSDSDEDDQPSCSTPRIHFAADVTCRSAGTTDSPCTGATELAVNSAERRDSKISSIILELVAANATPLVESAGTFMTMENADESGDPTAKVHADGSSEHRSKVQLLIPAGTTTELESPPSLDSIADGSNGARAEVYSLAHGKSTTPQAESRESVYGFDNKVAVGATNEGWLEVHMIVSSENTDKNPRSTHITADCADDPTDARAEIHPLGHDDCTTYPEEITENALDFDSEVPGVYQTAPDHGALLHLVPNDIQTSVENPERGDDELEDHNEVVVRAPTVVDSEVQLQLQNSEEIPSHMTTCPSRKEKCLGGVGVLDTGSQANDGESEVIGKEVWKQKFDGSVLGVASMCSLGADLKHCEDDGLLSIVCTIPKDDYDAIRDLRQQQASESLTAEVSTPRSGQMKLFSHRSCAAIKKAISIGCSRKRRREKNQLVTKPKRVCQIEPKPRPDSSGFQTDGCMQEPLSSSVPSKPANNKKRMSVMESIVKPELVTYEPENRTLVMDDSIHEPLWVLALPSIREGKFAAVEESIPRTTSSDMECRSATDESGLEDELDALERLTARVHVLGAQLRRHKMPKRNKFIWKIGDGRLYFSGDGEGAMFDVEVNDVIDTSHSWHCSDLNYVPEWYLQSVAAAAHVSTKALDGEARAPNSDSDDVPDRLPVSAKATTTLQEDADIRPLKLPRDSNVTCGRNSPSRRKVTKWGEKRRESVRNRVTRNAPSLRQLETANQFLLLGLGNIPSKTNCGLKRKQADIVGPKKDCKKMRVDASPALVEAVQKSANLSNEVDLPRMRGSVKTLKEKPEGSKKSKTSQKRDKFLDGIVGRKEKLLTVGFEQEQQLEDPHCGHIQQESVGNSSLSGLPTKCHLSSGSNHDISSPGKLDSEVLDIEFEENKIKLQPNGNWCIKAHTVDGKLEWIGSYPTKEAALSVYDVVNRFSCLRVKDVPPLSHTSFSCLGKRDGDHLSLDPLLNEKQLKCRYLERSNKCNASVSSSTAVEPNVGSSVLIKEANGTAADISRLEKNSGVDEKDEDHNAGALTNVSKSGEACEQDSSMISTKEDASFGMRVETSSGISVEGNIQESRNTQGETAHNLGAGPLISSWKGKVVNVDPGIQCGGTVQDVKVEVLEPQVVAAADSAHDSWIHDAEKCQSVKDAFDRVSMNSFETTEEIEVARQAKLALWRGISCSLQDTGLVSQGEDLFKRIQLWQSRMHFQDLIDGDAFKVLLSTGKSGEEIYVGHYKTAKEVDAVRKVLHRCKKGFAKSKGFLEASSNQQVTSGVIQTKGSHGGTLQKESSSSLAKATDVCARPTIATHATGDPSLQSLTISREVGRSLPRTEVLPKFCTAARDSTQISTSGQIPCRDIRTNTLHVIHKGRDASIQASAALVADHLPSLNERQAHVNSRIVATPPSSASEQKIIILDDDDDDGMDVTPVYSLPPRSANVGELTGAAPVGTINISIQPNSSPRENSVQGAPALALRTHENSNDGIPCFPRQIQEERCHLTGGLSAGQSCLRQTVPLSVQAGNADMVPIQSVGQGCGTPGAQIYGRALHQPPRQEWCGSQHASSTPFLVGNVVGQRQLVNWYGGTVGVNIVNSSGRQVEIPFSNLRALQGSVGVPTSLVPLNHLREVGGCSSLPTPFNSSTSAALRFSMETKFYNCCLSIGSCEEDFMLFKALRCRACNRLMHTQCAMALGQLRLRRNRTGQELAYYECACGRPWGIVPNILSRMEEFIQLIWRQQAERLNQVPHLARPVRIIDLHKGQELHVIMRVLQSILFGAKTDPMLTIFGNIEKMSRAIFADANRVDCREWLAFIKNALIRLGGSGHANQAASHG